MVLLKQPVTKENGERVIAGTRRADGTMRKEKKIKDGYTPEEQQTSYQVAGMQDRRGFQRCPGLDQSAVTLAAAAPGAEAKSKAQKKNEKRKQNREKGPAEDADVEEDLDEIFGMSSSLQQASISKPQTSQEPPKPKGPAASPAPVHEQASTSSAAAAAPEVSLEEKVAQAQKQIRALQKKLKQCEALQGRFIEGATLSTEELEKVNKYEGWSDEVLQLEHAVMRLLEPM